MNNDRLRKYMKDLESRGLTPERRRLVQAEAAGPLEHPTLKRDAGPPAGNRPETAGLYAFSDLVQLQGAAAFSSPYHTSIRSLDELLERDRQREKDGFPRKIRLGRLVRPGQGEKNKIVIVPTTVEEKFIHDRSPEQRDEEQSGGSGDGEEGEVIGEQPVREETGEGGAGHGEGASHEIESSAYDLGRVLTEKFQLPNLKEKGKKRSLTNYSYDLTDRNRGFGQFLDKKATLRRIVETNISLGNLDDVDNIDASRFLVAPNDMVYRILSRELDYESQAVVFFVRDYSGSMSGKPTELIVSQHLMIYSWLYYQYARRVESRFILHDTEAREVDDFYTYYNSKVAGGTRVASAYRLVNRIVADENLVQDYNIYVFQGTDGDDWDSEGLEAIPQLKQILTYANRVGVTIAEHGAGSVRRTEVERYLRNSKLLDRKKDLIRLDVVREDADEPRLIEGIRKLIS